MKVLIVTGKLTYSNRTTYTLELVRGLVHRGHEVQATAFGGPLYPQLEEYANDSYLVRSNYFSYRRLLQYLRDFDPGVIHATGGARALRTAARFASRLGKPLVHTVHSWLPEDREARPPRNISGVIAVNEDLREHLVNEQNVAKEMIRVIPYGVDGELHTGDDVVRSGDNVPVVGTIGRLERGRRQDEFLHMAMRVAERVEDVHFMIAGDGPDEARLRKMAKELCLHERVTFVQPHTNAPKLYSVIDVLVVVSDWGGVGLTLLEGMAHERAVIATGGGEVLSIVSDEPSCVLVPAGEPEQLVDEVVRLLGNRELREKMGRNARSFALQNFPLSQEVSRVEDFYGDIITHVPV